MHRSSSVLLRKCLRYSHLRTTSVRVMTSVSHVTTTKVEEKSFEDIPGPRGIYLWPVVGSLINFKPFTQFSSENFNELLLGMIDKYGPVVKLRLGNLTVVVSDPKDFETIYRNEGKYPNRGGTDIMDIFNKRTNNSPGLAQLLGPEWHAKRTPVNKRLMKVDSALHYLEQQNEVADDFVKILETHKTIPENLKDLFFRYASESIAVVTFNKRLGLFDQNPEQKSLDFLAASKLSLEALFEATSGQSVLHHWYRNSTYRKLEASVNFINKVTNEHVSQAKKILEDKMKRGEFKEDEPNLLFSLLSEKGLSSEDVSNTMAALYNAGTDSTAKNIQVFFYNLAKNPEKQRILHDEIVGVLGPSGPLTAKALTAMPYLKAALKESFRLVPPLPVANGRILPVDVTLGGYRVPAGTNIYLLNQKATKTNFENPDEFLPERWLRSEDNAKIDSTQSLIVLPFGYGPRNCVGRRFAVQEIYLAAVKVLQRLNIEVTNMSSISKFIYKPFAEADREIQFKFTPRR